MALCCKCKDQLYRVTCLIQDTYIRELDFIHCHHDEPDEARIRPKCWCDAQPHFYGLYEWPRVDSRMVKVNYCPECGRKFT